jgi:hypothetical protein
MRTTRETSVSVGPGFFTLLCVLFIGLKLTGYIAWSWWWVLAPLWLPAVVALAFIGIVAAIVASR